MPEKQTERLISQSTVLSTDMAAPNTETLSKIAEVYPELKAECMRQMKERG